MACPLSYILLTRTVLKVDIRRIVLWVCQKIAQFEEIEPTYIMCWCIIGTSWLGHFFLYGSMYW